MLRRVNLTTLLCCLAALALGCAPQPATPSLPLVEVRVGQARFLAEAPQKDQDRWKGLGGRDALAPNRGMVFIHDPARPASMHMGGMRFALDFVFCRGGRVVQITPNVSPYDAEARIVSDGPVDFVLELPAGVCRQLGLRLGDAASLGPLLQRPAAKP